MPVVVVESPAKAKKIKSYLGEGFEVIPSIGHVRDLPQKQGSVDPAKNFLMKWEVPAAASKRIQIIANALKKDDDLILATDPDREGEAISWHIFDILQKRRGAKFTGEPKRVVFNAVTKSAVLTAMENPRSLDMPLVNAYLARRALDYLVGYTLSPVLWRKLPCARSAGRVQSVCVRIIVEREQEIEAFSDQEYWSVECAFKTPRGTDFTARLTELHSTKITKLSIASEQEAKRAEQEIRARDFKIVSIKQTKKAGNPQPPFTTATLQQEANRKLRMSPRQTMRVAQSLYEDGLITYMRTDGVSMAPEAAHSARSAIQSLYGSKYLPKSVRTFRSKAKNSQEAHECIRPTDFHKNAGSLSRLSSDKQNLYSLIWNRATACQMVSARFLQTTAEIYSPDAEVKLRATGRVVEFDGYKKVYEEGKDEGDAHPDAVNRLPKLEEGDSLTTENVFLERHFTKPPPRFTEASLVKRMVELGIGRPSTYSSIVGTIQERGYVARSKTQLVPQPAGRLLNSFLKTYFARYVDFNFTASLEEELDDISGGRKQHLEVLGGFWEEFLKKTQAAGELEISAVNETLAENLLQPVMPEKSSGNPAWQCPRCSIGRLTLRNFANGNAFFSCSNRPACSYQITIDGKEIVSSETVLGDDPATGGTVSRRSGRFGPYVQLDSASNSKEKPKRASIPKNTEPESVDLATALQLLAAKAEKPLGKDAESGKEIYLKNGPYGPYVQLGPNSKGRVKPKRQSIPDGLDPNSIGLDVASGLLSLPRIVGKHPDDKKDISVNIGRQGPFVQHRNKRVYLNDARRILTIDREGCLKELAKLVGSPSKSTASVGS